MRGDLSGWRRRRLRRQLGLGAGLMITIYLLAGIAYGYFIWKGYREQLVLRQRIVQTKKIAKMPINLVAAPIVTALHQLVWQQQHQLRQLVNLLSVIPPDIILVGLECHGRVCECDVAAHSSQRLAQVFSQDELRDLKQGGCPLCYRAKIDVKL